MPEIVSNAHHVDCMEFLPYWKDKTFDLALVDAPYGIEDKISQGGGSHTKSKSKFHQRYKENAKTWDASKPDAKFWEQIFRVSKNQIVFGANYFVEFLPVSRGWAVWDKQGEGITTVNNELIFTSFDVSIRTFTRLHAMDKGFMNDHTPFHPTTKPVALYKWILKNYANEGDQILDPFMGSQSSRIAAYDMGFDFVGCELDKDYFDAGNKRFEQYKSQLKLF